MAQPPPPGKPDTTGGVTPPVPLPARYRFEQVLGEGGLGTVVCAFDSQLRTHVAIKTIRHTQTSQNPFNYDALRDRFEREAIAGAQAQVRNSPYVVTVYDLVLDSAGNAFLVLEYVPGGTLRDRLKDGLLPIAEALRLTADAARGLRDVHAANLVHRDIKPENIFIAADGHAKVGDLGIVQMGTTTFRTRLEYGSDRGHPGTPLYMSPEQANTTDFLTPEADQFSLGAVLFELVTGGRYKQVYAREREAALAVLPAGLAELIRRMTQEDPAERYRGMEAVLAAIAATDPTEAPRTVGEERESGAAVTVPETMPGEKRQQGDPRLEPPAPAPVLRRVRRRAVLAGVGGVAAAGTTGGILWVLGHRPPGPLPPTATAPGNSALTVPPTIAPIPPTVASPSPAAGSLVPTVTNVAATLAPPTAISVSPATAAPTTAPPAPTTTATGPVLHTLSGHTAAVNGVAFAPDGQTLASAGTDETVRLWRVSDGTTTRKLEGVHLAVRHPFYCVAFSPDGKLLVAGTDLNPTYAWSGAGFTPQGTFMSDIHTQVALAFSPDGQMLAAATQGKDVKRWRVSDGGELPPFTGHADFLRGVAFTPDGQLLASACRDGTIRLWRVADGTTLRSLTGHQGSVNGVTFAPDGKTLASVSDDRTIRLWRVADGTVLRTLTGHTDNVRGIAVSPDGQIVASGSDDQTVRLWRLSDGSALQVFSGHTNSISSVAFSPDGQTLASGSDDQTVRLWRL